MKYYFNLFPLIKKMHIFFFCLAINANSFSLLGNGKNHLNTSYQSTSKQKNPLSVKIPNKKFAKPLKHSIESFTGDSNLISSIKHVKDYNMTVNKIKNDKTLGFKSTDLKGVTTRQLTGAKDLYKKCAPGVVLLVSIDANSLGSGSLVNNRGEIITNWHVIEGQETMLVWFHDDNISNIQELNPESYAEADVIASDPNRDLALLKLREGSKQPASLKLGRNSQLSIAEDVFAIGHPESYIWSFTYGVISQLRNNYQWSYSKDVNLMADVIQTQTPTNPGNSGGPLFNDKGELIGINSFGSPESEGLNFAVRIGEIEDFMSEVRKGEHVPEPIVKSNNNSSEIVWDEYDENENGITDLLAADYNNDGEYDVIQIDANEDQITDIYICDTNYDGEHDLMITDKDNNGSFEHFLIDGDYDGVYDTEGIDTNGDMQPDLHFAYTGE